MRLSPNMDRATFWQSALNGARLVVHCDKRAGGTQYKMQRVSLVKERSNKTILNFIVLDNGQRIDLLSIYGKGIQDDKRAESSGDSSRAGLGDHS